LLAQSLLWSTAACDSVASVGLRLCCWVQATWDPLFVLVIVKLCDNLTNVLSFVGLMVRVVFWSTSGAFYSEKVGLTSMTSLGNAICGHPLRQRGQRLRSAVRRCGGPPSVCTLLLHGRGLAYHNLSVSSLRLWCHILVYPDACGYAEVQT
jgi:hypothetical protein